MSDSPSRPRCRTSDHAAGPRPTPGLGPGPLDTPLFLPRGQCVPIAILHRRGRPLRHRLVDSHRTFQPPAAPSAPRGGPCTQPGLAQADIGGAWEAEMTRLRSAPAQGVWACGSQSGSRLAVVAHPGHLLETHLLGARAYCRALRGSGALGPEAPGLLPSARKLAGLLLLGHFGWELLSLREPPRPGSLQPHFPAP